MTASSMAKTVTLTSCAPLPQIYLLAQQILYSLQGHACSCQDSRIVKFLTSEPMAGAAEDLPIFPRSRERWLSPGRF